MLNQWSSSSRIWATAGRRSVEIFAWLWPCVVRRPVSLMMIWNTPASATPCSSAIPGGTALVSLTALARAGLTVGQLQREPVDCRADGGQVAEFTAPNIGRDGADRCDGFEYEVADGGGRSGGGLARADQVAQSILNLLAAVGEQVLLRRKVVVDRLLGNLGLARHITNSDVFITVLGEQAGCAVGDESAGACLLEVTQSGGGHLDSVPG